MKDEQLRALERLAAEGDQEAAARLVMFNRKKYPCSHWVASKRQWVQQGQPRHDRFCTFCGMNLDLAGPAHEPLFWEG